MRVHATLSPSLSLSLSLPLSLSPSLSLPLSLSLTGEQGAHTLFTGLKGMTVALAPFTYLVIQ